MAIIKILVIDDHTLFRKGIIKLLEKQKNIKVVGEAKDGEEGYLKAKEIKPDIILMDIKMPVLDGVAATKKIKSEFPDIDIIILTVSDKDEDLFAAVKAGAKGYILKDVDPKVLINSIVLLSEGEPAISPDMAKKIFNEFSQIPQKADEYPPVKEKKDNELSARENDILKLLSRGSTNKEIATELSISENTVKIHIRHILKKLNLNNRTQAALYGMKDEKITKK